MSAQIYAPMTGGLETNIDTGDPVQVGAIARQAREEERRNRRLERHLALVEDLAGGGGSVVRAIAQKLVLRIEHLVANDEQAAAYLTLLKDLQQELRVGERIVADEVEDLFERP